jgi:hypothetical protein
VQEQALKTEIWYWLALFLALRLFRKHPTSITSTDSATGTTSGSSEYYLVSQFLPMGAPN